MSSAPSVQLPSITSPQAGHAGSTPELAGRLHFIDALRGLAALGVMLFHFFAASVSPLHDALAQTLPAWAGWVISHLDSGVEVFFVLRGFVIALSMDGNRHDWRYAGNFVLRRSVRLDPTYWAAGAIMIAYWFIRWPEYWYDSYVMWGGIRGLLANMFYVQNLTFIYPAKSVVEVAWTLCLEVQFYLTYLVILVTAYYVGGIAGTHGHIVRRAVIVLAVASIGVWSLMNFMQVHTANFADRSWTFMMGVGIFAALNGRVRMGWVLPPLMGLGAWFCWQGDVHGVVGIAAAGVIYAVGSYGRLGSALAYRPLLYLGRISYSLYLMHMVVGIYGLFFIWSLFEGGGIAAAWVTFIAAIGLSVLSAELLHRFVEAPTNRWSRRLKMARVPDAKVGTDRPLGCSA